MVFEPFPQNKVSNSQSICMRRNISMQPFKLYKSTIRSLVSLEYITTVQY